MAKSENASKRDEYKTARLQYVWAPLITALAGLITAVVLHFMTESKLGDASTNFQKLSDSVQALTNEAALNRRELDHLNQLVEDIIDNLIARRESSPPAAAASSATAGLEKLQDLKKQIATSRIRMQDFAVKPPPQSMFAH